MSNNLVFTEIVDIATTALGLIASTTEDAMPPFRSMPASRMSEIAVEALGKITKRLAE